MRVRGRGRGRSRVWVRCRGRGRGRVRVWVRVRVRGRVTCASGRWRPRRPSLVVTRGRPLARACMFLVATPVMLKAGAASTR